MRRKLPVSGYGMVLLVVLAVVLGAQSASASFTIYWSNKPAGVITVKLDGVDLDNITEIRQSSESAVYNITLEFKITESKFYGNNNVKQDIKVTCNNQVVISHYYYGKGAPQEGTLHGTCYLTPRTEIKADAKLEAWGSIAAGSKSWKPTVIPPLKSKTYYVCDPSIQIPIVVKIDGVNVDNLTQIPEGYHEILIQTPDVDWDWYWAFYVKANLYCGGAEIAKHEWGYRRGEPVNSEFVKSYCYIAENLTDTITLDLFISSLSGSCPTSMNILHTGYVNVTPFKNVILATIPANKYLVPNETECMLYAQNSSTKSYLCADRGHRPQLYVADGVGKKAQPLTEGIRTVNRSDINLYTIQYQQPGYSCDPTLWVNSSDGTPYFSVSLPTTGDPIILSLPFPGFWDYSTCMNFLDGNNLRIRLTAHYGGGWFDYIRLEVTDKSTQNKYIYGLANGAQVDLSYSTKGYTIKAWRCGFWSCDYIGTYDYTPPTPQPLWVLDPFALPRVPTIKYTSTEAPESKFNGILTLLYNGKYSITGYVPDYCPTKSYTLFKEGRNTKTINCCIPSNTTVPLDLRISPVNPYSGVSFFGLDEDFDGVIKGNKSSRVFAVSGGLNLAGRLVELESRVYPGISYSTSFTLESAPSYPLQQKLIPARADLKITGGIFDLRGSPSETVIWGYNLLPTCPTNDIVITVGKTSTRVRYEPRCAIYDMIMSINNSKKLYFGRDLPNVLPPGPPASGSSERIGVTVLGAKDMPIGYHEVGFSSKRDYAFCNNTSVSLCEQNIVLIYTARSPVNIQSSVLKLNNKSYAATQVTKVGENLYNLTFSIPVSEIPETTTGVLEVKTANGYKSVNTTILMTSAVDMNVTSVCAEAPPDITPGNVFIYIENPPAGAKLPDPPHSEIVRALAYVYDGEGQIDQVEFAFSYRDPMFGNEWVNKGIKTVKTGSGNYYITDFTFDVGGYWKITAFAYSTFGKMSSDEVTFCVGTYDCPYTPRPTPTTPPPSCTIGINPFNVPSTCIRSGVVYPVTFSASTDCVELKRAELYLNNQLVGTTSLSGKSVSNVQFNLEIPPTTVSVSAPSSVTYGSPLTVNVSYTNARWIDLYVDGTLLENREVQGNGTTTFTVTGLSPGTHTIKAVARSASEYDTVPLTLKVYANTGASEISRTLTKGVTICESASSEVTVEILAETPKLSTWCIPVAPPPGTPTPQDPICYGTAEIFTNNYLVGRYYGSASPKMLEVTAPTPISRSASGSIEATYDFSSNKMIITDSYLCSLWRQGQLKMSTSGGATYEFRCS